ncbi:DUF4251 domain-containing protein [Costertonia aggregata]|uniref:DUF4251 domain-containing protein n=1 Tax=Costertonia aggregata TaxID=343403 RepID=A0A7H9ATY8_9FLAO|nr:DUF4251 domain-containing protein [Costertonia aggregata]QLG46924.1 DUF4251 domain-containing protein [Costertonia aggregata]
METIQNKILKCSLIVLLFIVAGCASKSKVKYSQEQLSQVNEMVSNKKFEINSQRALPLTTNALQSVINAGILLPDSNAGSINLLGNTNHLRMYGDSISIYLPYFGERQLAAAYNNNEIGIQVDSVLEDADIDFNEDRNRYEITFSAEQDMESLNFRLIIFPNLNSTIYVNSSHRNPITYQGKVTPVSE